MNMHKQCKRFAVNVNVETIVSYIQRIRKNARYLGWQNDNPNEMKGYENGTVNAGIKSL